MGKLRKNFLHQTEKRTPCIVSKTYDSYIYVAKQI